MEEARRKRAAALEEKKKRLEEMRKKRAEREGGGGRGGIGGIGGEASVEEVSASARPPPRLTTRTSDRAAAEGGQKGLEEEGNEQLDALIDSLLSAPPPSIVSSMEEEAGEEGGGEEGKDGCVDEKKRTRTIPSSCKGDANVIGALASPEGGMGVSLSVVQALGKIVIPPAPAVECYDKSTQTDLLFEEEEEEEEEEERRRREDRKAQASAGGGQRGKGKGGREGGDEEEEEGEEEKEEEGGEGGDGTRLAENESAGSPAAKNAGSVKPSMTTEEKEAELSRPELVSFLSRASLLVERAVGQDESYNIFVEYCGQGREEEGGEEKRKRESGGGLTRLLQFSVARRRRRRSSSSSSSTSSSGNSREGARVGGEMEGRRAVMDLHWSPHFPELFLAAYSGINDGSGDIFPSSSNSFSSSSSPSFPPSAAASFGAEEMDGLVLVWSLALPSRPELRFACPSPVLTSRFHPSDPHLLFGGTYSGQVVAWDTRAKALPVQRSPLSTAGHTHPVYALEVQGSGDSIQPQTLLSASADGRVCRWDIRQLSQPLEVTHVRHYDGCPPSSSCSSRSSCREQQQQQQQPPRNVSITAFTLQRDGKGEDEMVVGGESGHMYLHFPSSSSSSSSSSSFSLSSLSAGRGAMPRQWEGHNGLITGLSQHPSSLSSSFPSSSSSASSRSALGPLVLSSSVDWTIKLWDTQRPQCPLLASFSHGATCYDCVNDVAWCPAHPAVFASVTSGGHLGLWNLNQSLEAPLIPPFPVMDTTTAAAPPPLPPTSGSLSTCSSRKASSSTALPPSLPPPQPSSALTRVCWSRDGRKLAVGDTTGNVHVLGVAEEWVRSRVDEDMRLEETLSLLVQQQQQE